MKAPTRLALIGVAMAGLAAAAQGQALVGSDHDFSNENWSGGEICKPCHTPHFAKDVGYLWAHELSVENYTLFDGSTSSPGGVNELDVYSRMCLSCHDGTVALNDFHNGGGTDVFIDEGSRVGADGDLSDDHPIGNTAEYPVNGAPGRWQPASLTPSGVWGFGGGGFPEVPLFEHNGEQVVSCSTCHNPHGKAGIPNLLRKDNAGSALCFTCHIK